MLSLTPDGCILIVGSKPSNFKRSWLENKRLIFWHSTDGELRFREIPKKVEIIIFSKFVRHSFYEKVYKMAKTSGIKFFRFVHNTGEIKSLIEESGILKKEEPLRPFPSSMPVNIPNIIEEEKKVERAEEEFERKEDNKEMVKAKAEDREIEQKNLDEKQVERPKRGLLKKFLLENADFNNPYPRKEIKKIFQLALERGLKTTPASVEFCFYRERKKIKEKAQPLPAKKIKRRGRRKDSVAAIEKFINLSEIAAVAARELKEENDFLREENEKLRKTLLELKDLIRKI